MLRNSTRGNDYFTLVVAKTDQKPAYYCQKKFSDDGSGEVVGLTVMVNSKRYESNSPQEFFEYVKKFSGMDSLKIPESVHQLLQLRLAIEDAYAKDQVSGESLRMIGLRIYQATKWSKNDGFSADVLTTNLQKADALWHDNELSVEKWLSPLSSKEEALLVMKGMSPGSYVLHRSNVGSSTEHLSICYVGEGNAVHHEPLDMMGYPTLASLSKNSKWRVPMICSEEDVKLREYGMFG
jgi:hypothetical protein